MYETSYFMAQQCNELQYKQVGIDLVETHLRMDYNVGVRGAPPDVSLLDLRCDALSADTVDTVRPRAVVVELLPVVVEHHGRLDVRLAVQQTLLDDLEHAVTFLVGLQQEDDFDFGPISSLDGIQCD